MNRMDEINRADRAKNSDIGIASIYKIDGVDGAKDPNISITGINRIDRVEDLDISTIEIDVKED